MKKNLGNKIETSSVEPNVSFGKSIIYLVFFAILLFGDQWSKAWVLANDKLMNGESITVIENFWNFKYAFNTGAAFSFLADAEWGIYVLSGLSIIASIAILIFMLRKSNWPVLFPLSLSFILAGSVGNMYDRIVMKGVIDFLDFYYKEYHFATFNLADTWISIGAGLLLIYMIFFYEKDAARYGLDQGK